MKKKDVSMPALLDSGTCGIHTNAEKASEWGIGKVLKCLSEILMVSPTRREALQKIH